MLSIGEIREEFKNAGADELSGIIKKYSDDARPGVQKLKSQYESKLNRSLKERERLLELWRYENEFYSKGALFVAGTDEVGRGPLAGPVMAAAVILPRGIMIPGINDSKKLSGQKREGLSEKILEKAVAFGFGEVSPEEIDEINILNATLKAIRNAVLSLSPAADALLADALSIPGLAIPQKPIIKGDSASVSIAAASIIAKVKRDRLMSDYSLIYPEYSFDKNKGYGTAEHIDAIRQYGPCPIHRKSFIKNFVSL